jgi:hypothetical protein
MRSLLTLSALLLALPAFAGLVEIVPAEAVSLPGVRPFFAQPPAQLAQISTVLGVDLRSAPIQSALARVMSLPGVSFDAAAVAAQPAAAQARAVSAALGRAVESAGAAAAQLGEQERADPSAVGVAAVASAVGATSDLHALLPAVPPERRPALDAQATALVALRDRMTLRGFGAQLAAAERDWRNFGPGDAGGAAGPKAVETERPGPASPVVGRGDYRAALSRAGLSADEIAALEAVAGPSGRARAGMAAALAHERPAEFTGPAPAAWIAAALLRDADASRADAHAALAGLAPAGRLVPPLTTALLDGAAGAGSLTAPQAAWAREWSSHLDFLDAVMKAGDDAARLAPLTKSPHFAYLPEVLREDVSAAVDFHARGAVPAPGAAPVTADAPRVERQHPLLDRAQELAASVAAEFVPAPRPAPGLLDDTYKTRGEVVRGVGFDPFWARGEQLSYKPGFVEVKRVTGPDGESRVVKTITKEFMDNELVIRGVIESFAPFNETLRAPRAVAYPRWFGLGRPVMVMEDVKNTNPLVDARFVPLDQRAALAALALTFGIHDLNPGAFLEVTWERTTIADFEKARAPIRARPENSMGGLSETAWVSDQYFNRMEDYRPTLDRWRRTFAAPETQERLAEILRRTGASPQKIADDLALFAKNLDALETVLAADIAYANRSFQNAARQAGLDEKETRLLSEVNRRAHVSPEGGAARDILRMLNARAGVGSEFYPFALQAWEAQRFAVGHPSGAWPAERDAIMKAAAAGTLKGSGGTPISPAAARRALDVLAGR